MAKRPPSGLAAQAINATAAKEGPLNKGGGISPGLAPSLISPVAVAKQSFWVSAGRVFSHETDTAPARSTTGPARAQYNGLPTPDPRFTSAPLLISRSHRGSNPKQAAMC